MPIYPEVTISTIYCVYTTKSFLEQLTSFPQTFLLAVGPVNLHPTVNRFNTTSFERDLTEIKTDLIVLTFARYIIPKCRKLRLRNLSETK